MILLYAIVGLSLFALLTSSAALVMVILANRRAKAVEECAVFRDVEMKRDLTVLDARVKELRQIAQRAGERSTLAFEAAQAFRRGRRITDPVVPFPPLPPLPKP